MNFLDWLSQFKELTCLGVLTVPLAGLLFFTKQQFEWSNPQGFFTKVKLFTKKPQSSSVSPAQANSSVPKSNEHLRYQLVKVSDGRSSSSGVTLEATSSLTAPSSGDTDNKVLSLVLELPLKRLWNWGYYRYCLPKNSLLKKKEKPQTASVSAQSSTSNEDCDLQWYEGWKSNQEAEEGVVFLLLTLVTKWLYVQHFANMKQISNDDQKTQQVAGSPASYSRDFVLIASSEPTQSQQSTVNKEQLKKACDTTPKGSQDHDLYKTLMLSSDAYRKCYLPPSTVELTLEPGAVSKPEAASGPAGTPTTVTSEASVSSRQGEEAITTERIKKGTLTGLIYYGLFDYWGGSKELDSSHSQEKKHTYIYLKRTKQTTYTLDDEKPYRESEQGSQQTDRISLSKLYEKLQSNDLDSKDFESQGNKRERR
nr:hypothetical protein [Candidatus Mycoplasma haematolamae]